MNASINHPPAADIPSTEALPWSRGELRVGPPAPECSLTPFANTQPGNAHDDPALLNHYWYAARLQTLKAADYTCSSCGHREPPSPDGISTLVVVPISIDEHRIDGEQVFSCVHHLDNLQTLCLACSLAALPLPIIEATAVSALHGGASDWRDEGIAGSEYPLERPDPKRPVPCESDPERWWPDLTFASMAERQQFDRRELPYLAGKCAGCYFRTQCAINALQSAASGGVMSGVVIRETPHPTARHRLKLLKQLAGYVLDGPADSETRGRWAETVDRIGVLLQRRPELRPVYLSIVKELRAATATPEQKPAPRSKAPKERTRSSFRSEQLALPLKVSA